MSIMTRLKSATAELHRLAEGSSLQQRLVKGALPQDLYAAFLGQMYLTHSALEDSIRDVSATHRAFAEVLRDYHWREPQLSEDLDFLGTDLDTITAIGSTGTLVDDIHRAAAEQPVALLGILYVLEGSTNGSKFIAKAIRKAYGLGQGPGASYLDPHGDLQRERWQAFKRDMDGVGFTETEASAIIDAARRMFRALTDVSDELSEPVGGSPPRPGTAAAAPPATA